MVERRLIDKNALLDVLEQRKKSKGGITMDIRGKLVELLAGAGMGKTERYFLADYLIAHGVTMQECAHWQYDEEGVDEDNNVQAYYSFCGAGDKHATSMIGKIPYCWKCGRNL